MFLSSRILYLFAISTTVLGTIEKHRIVGGQNVTRNEFPWLVYIIWPSTFCGGAILDENWILTSASCVGNRTADGAIFAGSHHLADTGPPMQATTMLKIVIHEGYDALALENDIAMVQVSYSFIFTPEVQPIQLPSENYAPQGEVILAGWGETSETSSTSLIPQKVNLTLVPFADCAESYNKNIAITDKMICARAENKYYCERDSGGPLLCRENGELVGCGIATLVQGCVQPLYPGVYTRVSSFLNWIHTTTQPPTTTPTTTTVRTTTSDAKNRASNYFIVLFYVIICCLSL